MINDSLSDWPNGAKSHERSIAHRFNLKSRSESSGSHDESADMSTAESANESSASVENPKLKSRRRKLSQHATKFESMAGDGEDDSKSDEDSSKWIDIPEDWKSLKPQNASRRVDWSMIPQRVKSMVVKDLFGAAARCTWIDSSDRARQAAIELGVFWCRKCGTCHNTSGISHGMSQLLQYHREKYHSETPRANRSEMPSQRSGTQAGVRRKCLDRMEEVHREFRWIDTSQEARDLLQHHGTYRCVRCRTTLIVPWHGNVAGWKARARQHEQTAGHQQASHKIAQPVAPPSIDVIEISDDESVQSLMIPQQPQFVPMSDESHETELDDHTAQTAPPSSEVAAALTQAAETAPPGPSGLRSEPAEPQPTPPHAPVRPKSPRLPHLARLRESSPPGGLETRSLTGSPRVRPSLTRLSKVFDDASEFLSLFH